MSDIECPYCEYGLDIDHDGYEQDESVEQECPQCEKSFIFTIHYSVSYHALKADCLNNGKHNWQPIHGWPKEHFKNKRRCSMCNKEISLEEK